VDIDKAKIIENQISIQVVYLVIVLVH